MLLWSFIIICLFLSETEIKAVGKHCWQQWRHHQKVTCMSLRLAKAVATKILPFFCPEKSEELLQCKKNILDYVSTVSRNKSLTISLILWSFKLCPYSCLLSLKFKVNLTEYFQRLSIFIQIHQCFRTTMPSCGTAVFCNWSCDWSKKWHKPWETTCCSQKTVLPEIQYSNGLLVMGI